MKTPIIISLIVSSLFTVVLVRGCFSGLFPQFICGYTNLTTSYSKLNTTQIKEVESIVNEHTKYSLELGNGADNLVDGDEKTLAAPASNQIDYIVSLTEVYKIKEISILWQGYPYIRSWALEASSDGNKWKEIYSNNSAPGSQTIIDNKFDASFIRLKAEAENNWIGAYELSIIGKPAN